MVEKKVTWSATRTELVERLGVSVGVLRNWEHQGLLSPTVTPGRSGSPSPARYSPVDAAIAGVLTALAGLRVEIKAYSPALSLLSPALTRKPAGWAGWASLTSDGMLELHNDPDSAGRRMLDECANGTGVIVIPVQVPA